MLATVINTDSLLAKPEQPVAYSAVFSNSVSSLFYARANGKLAELFQPSSRAKYSYDPQSVKSDNSVDVTGVNKNSLVSAVSWRSSDGRYHVSDVVVSNSVPAADR